MKITQTLAAQLSGLLAADTTLLANAVANKIALIIADFTPTIDKVIGDLTLATDGGLAPLAQTAGAQLESTDPVTGERVVEIKSPAGGNRWESLTHTYPVTVYGWALVNGAVSALYMSEKFDEPIVITADNQQISKPNMRLRIDANQVS